MASNQLAVAALGAACIVAAAGGGYVALRQNAVPTPAAASAPLAPTTLTTPNRPVQETEAAIGEMAKSTAPTPVVTPSSTKSAPAKRDTSPSVPRQTRTPRAAANHADVPQLERSWPASAQSSPVPAPVTPDPEPAARSEERAAQEPPRAPEPPQRTFEELVVSSDSVLGLQTENRLSSETARVEDRVEARVTRDVKVADRVAIPAGSRALGSVTLVERGGKFKERARLGIQFHTLVLADGTRLPVKTETIYRDGDAPGNSSAAKIGGGAVGGAILGAILGGARGAAIGATAGAGGGAAVVAAGDRAAATLPAGTPMTVRVVSPVTVTIEQ